MSNVLAQDLQFAIASEKAVNIDTVQGRRYEYKGVKEVNEPDNWVTLWNPQTFGDDTTFERLALSLISSVTVTDVEYPTPGKAV